jgi:hypothetical protein
VKQEKWSSTHFFLLKNLYPKKKKHQQEAANILFLLNFFVLFCFVAFSFWVPIKICKTKLCKNLSTKTHIKKQTSEETKVERERERKKRE